MSHATFASLLRIVVPWLVLLGMAQADASPVTPLRNVTLSSQGEYDRGCDPIGLLNQDCNRGCAFVGERLYCWGENASGQLGIGRRTLNSLAQWVRRPDRASGDFDRPLAVAVANASRRSCVLDAAGVWCWSGVTGIPPGSGNSDTHPLYSPALVPGLPTDLAQLELAPHHTCVRSRAQGAWCWGRNNVGEAGRPPVLGLFRGSYFSYPVDSPHQVPGLPAVIDEIALGEAHSCALASGRVWCWGDPEAGQAILRPGMDHSTPVAVAQLPDDAVAIDAGRLHTCALTAGGDVWCWGGNSHGQLGVAGTGVSRTPLRVPGLPGAASAIKLTAYQSCALVGGRRWCWGADDFLHQAGFPPHEAPRADGAPRDWLGGCFSENGVLQCRSSWLRHPYRSFDARPQSPEVQRPVEVVLGRDYGCARGADGSVGCWGFGPAALASVPIPRALALSAGARHACARTIDGLWCWGDNTTGALGDGSLEARSAPVRARFEASLVAAGDGHTCAFDAPSGLRCWGRNDHGQVSATPGSGPLPDGATPIGNVAVEQLAVGFRHSCATLLLGPSTRETRCWGRLPLTAADLATGVVDFSPRPVPAGAALPGESVPRLRSAAFGACVGDRCYGLAHLPPDTDAARVELPLVAPAGQQIRDFALGHTLSCVQGVGSKVYCSMLESRSCEYAAATGTLGIDSTLASCLAGEANRSALQRGWLEVIGLPAAPDSLIAGEYTGCAIVAAQVWCWSRNPVPLFLGPFQAPVYRAGAIEPAPGVPLTLDPARACAAYPVASVSLLEPAAASDAGSWGLDLLLADGRRYLNGGLNFGGFGTAAGAGVPGYAAFSIQNPLGPSQRVTLDLSGDGGEFVLTVESTVPPSTTRTEVLRDTLTLDATPQRRSLTLPNGFHIVGLQPVSGTRLFLAAVGTTQPDGGPAAFQGGAVVGGYLEGERTGFAAVCTDDASAIDIRTQARSTRDAAGAGDLRLQVIEGQTGAVLYDSQ